MDFEQEQYCDLGWEYSCTKAEHNKILLLWLKTRESKTDWIIDQQLLQGLKVAIPPDVLGTMYEEVYKAKMTMKKIIEDVLERSIT